MNSSLTSVIRFFLIVLFLSVIGLSQTNLVKYSGNPVLAPGSPGDWDDAGIHSPMVIFEGSNYKMWFSGADGSPDGQGIGYATSSDGLNWVKYSGNPVLSGNPGEWDRHIHSCSVVNVQGMLYMFYTGATSGSAPNKIGLAKSTDGINWTKFSGNPILDRGLTGEWDDELVRGPWVIYNGNQFLMWYAGKRPGSPADIGFATSPDGEVWQKYTNNPVLDFAAFGSNSGESPSVIWDGLQYIMYVGANTWGAHNLADIGVYFSTDGIDWAESPSNPVLQAGPSSEWDAVEVGIPGALLYQNVYKVWYTSNGAIGFAEDIPLEISDVEIHWHSKTPFSAVHGFANVEAIGSKLYLPGGGTLSHYNNPVLSIYDIYSDTWRQGANMPSAKAGNSGSTVLEGLFYAIGGEGPGAGRWSSENEAYDPQANQWYLKATWPSPRRDIGVATADGKMYVVGGQPNYSNISSNVDAYDPGTNIWMSAASYPISISGVATIGLNDKIYAFGGATGPNQANRSSTNRVFRYDPDINSWQELAGMPEARMSMSVAVYNEKIYLLGGQKNNIWLDGPKNNVWEYDPVDDKFRDVVSMGMLPLYGNGIHLPIYEDSVYFVGTFTYNDQNSQWNYEPTLLRGEFVSPNSAPVAMCQNAEAIANQTCSADASIDNGSYDPDGDPITLIQDPPGPYPLGTTEVTLTVTDDKGASSQCTATVTVLDGTPPALVANPDPAVFWPPNHSYETIELSQMVSEVSDNCANLTIDNIVITSVTSDEPESGNGDGNTFDDIVIAADCQSVQLRKERSGNGNGRVYSVHLAVNDDYGNTGTAIYRVWVPISRNGSAMDDGVDYSVNSSCSSGFAKLALDDNAPSNLIPEGYSLKQNYPNPFNPTTTIRFNLPEEAQLTLKIYNSTGQLVQVLATGQMSAGKHELVWNATDISGNQVASGMYLYRLTTGHFTQTRKMLLMR